MAQGRSTKIISMFKWIRTSRLSIKNSLYLSLFWPPWGGLMIKFNLSQSKSPLKRPFAPTAHPGGNPGANLKSISHRCHPILVAFVWGLTKETIHLPLGCLQGGSRPAYPPQCNTPPHLARPPGSVLPGPDPSGARQRVSQHLSLA